MERRVRGDALGRDRSVIQLDFTDLPQARSRWWFLHQGERTQLCVHDPGFEVDLYLAASVADMIRVWQGDVPVKRALSEERIEAHGPRAMIRGLEGWLNLSPLAAVAPATA